MVCVNPWRIPGRHCGWVYDHCKKMHASLLSKELKKWASTFRIPAVAIKTREDEDSGWDECCYHCIIKLLIIRFIGWSRAWKLAWLQAAGLIAVVRIRRITSHVPLDSLVIGKIISCRFALAFLRVIRLSSPTVESLSVFISFSVPNRLL